MEVCLQKQLDGFLIFQALAWFVVRGKEKKGRGVDLLNFPRPCRVSLVIQSIYFLFNLSSKFLLLFYLHFNGIVLYKLVSKELLHVSSVMADSHRPHASPFTAERRMIASPSISWLIQPSSTNTILNWHPHSIDTCGAFLRLLCSYYYLRIADQTILYSDEEEMRQGEDRRLYSSFAKFKSPQVL
ncbi:hypothetical protein ACOSQ4_031637 [Xanthoceras sorbifolium]